MQQQHAADVVAEAARQYTEELGRWRQQRKRTKFKLATLMTYDRSYVSHVESGTLPPTEDFTRRAEAVLDTAGALWARWEAYETARIGNARNSPRSGRWRATGPEHPHPAGLARRSHQVEHRPRAVPARRSRCGRSGPSPRGTGARSGVAPAGGGRDLGDGHGQ